jgi:hypothetical protein
MREAQELYMLLQDCMDLLDRVESKSRKVERQVATKLLVVLNAALGVLRRMDLGEEYNQIVSKTQRLVQLLMVLRASLMATYTTMGPLGWVLAGVGMVGAALTIDDAIATLIS